MKKRVLIRGLIALLLGGASLPSSADSPGAPTGFELTSGERTLIVRAQTADEAHSYVAGLLDDMDFFRANGYQVALPNHPAFAADSRSPGSAEVFAAEVYREAEFGSALEILEESRGTLQKALEWFEATSALEGFRAFERYKVTLTLYGPGGSYNPETGTIVLFTTPDGRFKGGGGAHTVIHEMMHLAIEEGFVQRFGLSHWEKERLVDLLVKREFSDLLPDYRLQNLGEKALDPHVQDVLLGELAEALDGYASARRKH
ncbi:MAG: hypothetical protein AAF725_04900 [Acidobacteriota bacterium]